jgi:hypothetical protein
MGRRDCVREIKMVGLWFVGCELCARGRRRVLEREGPTSLSRRRRRHARACAARRSQRRETRGRQRQALFAFLPLQTCTPLCTTLNSLSNRRISDARRLPTHCPNTVKHPHKTPTKESLNRKNNDANRGARPRRRRPSSPPPNVPSSSRASSQSSCAVSRALLEALPHPSR